MRTGSSIGVLGGMGPHAGFDLAVKITNQTLAATDHEHLPVVVLSVPHTIPDRSTFLLDRTQPSPIPALINLAEQLERAGAGAIGIPCNTAHAAPILEPLVDALATRGSKIRVVDMIQETVRHIQNAYPAVQRVGVLSTTAVYRLRLYANALKAAGLMTVAPDESMQETIVNPTIFDAAWGLKAQAHPVTTAARAHLLDAIAALKAQGAEAIILGCTELPLAVPEPTVDGLPMVDPTVVLARALIRETFPDKLRPLPSARRTSSVPDV